MEEKKRDKRFYFKAGGILGMFVIGLVVASLLNYPVADTVNHMVVSPRSWKPLGYIPSDGYGCIINISTYPHSADPTNDYSANVTSDNCYEWYDSYGTAPGAGGTEMNSTTPHSTAFDFLIKIRTNVTNNFNTSSGKWETRWVKGYIKVTWSDAGHAKIYKNLTVCNITNNASYCFYYLYDNFNNTGYTISAGETFVVDFVSVYTYQ